MTTASRVPRRLSEFVPWLQSRVTLWAGGQSGPPDIGLSSDQVAALAVLTDDFVAKYNMAQALRGNARAATIEQNTALDAVRAMLGGDIEIIDGYAKATADPDVYARAQIPPPKDRTPRTEAPKPTNLEVRATTNGNIVLTFEANKGLGSVFIIQRRYKTIDGVVTQFKKMDTIAEKTWTDTNVPNGLLWIGYQVATRLTNNVLSDWSTEKAFNFGTIGNQNPSSVQGQQASAPSGPDGGQSLTIEDAQALKDAQTAKGAMKAS